MLTLLIPTVVAIVSWFVGSWLSVSRDRANKRRDLRVQYLVEAYRRLEAAGQVLLEDLLSILRDDLRAELQLGPVKGRLTYLRFTF